MNCEWKCFIDNNTGCPCSASKTSSSSASSSKHSGEQFQQQLQQQSPQFHHQSYRNYGLFEYWHRRGKQPTDQNNQHKSFSFCNHKTDTTLKDGSKRGKPQFINALNPPQCRAYHAATIAGHKMYVFGGHTSRVISTQRRLLNDMAVLDLDTFVWQEITTRGTQPCELRAMSMVSIWDETALMLYGGFDRLWMPRNEVYILNLEKMEWKQMKIRHVSQSSSLDPSSWTQLPKSAGVAAINVPWFRNGTVLLIGGNQGNVRTNSVISVSISEEPFIWQYEETIGDELPELSTATACTVNHFNKYHNSNASDILLFGGWNGRTSYNHLFLLNLERMEWKRIHTTGTIPPKRVGHTFTNFYGQFLVLGGHDEQTNTMDNRIYSLDLDKGRWKLLPDISAEYNTVYLKGHTACMYRNRMIVFGGHNGSEFTNNLHIVEFTTLHHDVEKLWYNSLSLPSLSSLSSSIHSFSDNSS